MGFKMKSPYGKGSHDTSSSHGSNSNYGKSGAPSMLGNILTGGMLGLGKKLMGKGKGGQACPPGQQAPQTPGNPPPQPAAPAPAAAAAPVTPAPEEQQVAGAQMHKSLKAGAPKVSDDDVPYGYHRNPRTGTLMADDGSGRWYPEGHPKARRFEEPEPEPAEVKSTEEKMKEAIDKSKADYAKQETSSAWDKAKKMGRMLKNEAKAAAAGIGAGLEEALDFPMGEGETLPPGVASSRAAKRAMLRERERQNLEREKRKAEKRDKEANKK